jgi:hypothetical protein
VSKYYGLPYDTKTRLDGPVDRIAIDKTFEDDHPERNALLRVLVDRVNRLIFDAIEANTREAHDIAYTDANGRQRNVGDMLDDLALGEVNTIILVDPEGNILVDPEGNTLAA